jgi:hypothetical protein
MKIIYPIQKPKFFHNHLWSDIAPVAFETSVKHYSQNWKRFEKKRQQTAETTRLSENAYFLTRGLETFFFSSPSSAESIASSFARRACFSAVKAASAV